MLVLLTGRGACDVNNFVLGTLRTMVTRGQKPFHVPNDSISFKGDTDNDLGVNYELGLTKGKLYLSDLTTREIVYSKEVINPPKVKLTFDTAVSAKLVYSYELIGIADSSAISQGQLEIYWDINLETKMVTTAGCGITMDYSTRRSTTKQFKVVVNPYNGTLHDVIQTDDVKQLTRYVLLSLLTELKYLSSGIKICDIVQCSC